MRNTALDNPRFLAIMIGDWLNNWKQPRQPAERLPQAKLMSRRRKLDISDKGRYIFATHCAACHTIGHGDKIGPDLLGVTNVRERELARALHLHAGQGAGGERSHCYGALSRNTTQVNMPNLRLADVDLQFLD